MGELTEDFALMKEAARERRNKIEPQRVAFARTKLHNMGFETDYDEYNRCLLFTHKGHSCKIYPFTGWWTGKGIGSDRGIKKLVKKLQEDKKDGR